MAQSQNQNSNGQQATASNTEAERREISVWQTTGAHLEVDVGGGQYVPIPNPDGREPTREEIYQALVAAGHQERADELADKAYGDVSGTG